MATRHIAVHETGQGTTTTSYTLPYATSWSTTNQPARCAYQLKVKQIGVKLTTAPGASKSWTFDLLKNGNTTGITFSIANTDTTGFAILTAGVSYNEDDTITLRRTAVNSPTLPGVVDIVWQWDMQQNNQSSYMLRWGSSQSNAFFNSPLGARFASTGNPPIPIPIAGTFTKVKINLSTAPTTGRSYTFNLYKNGVIQDGVGGTVDTTITIADSDTTGEWSGTLTAAEGDTFSARINPSGTPVSSEVAVGIGFTPTIDGETFLVAGTDQNLSSVASTRFNTIGLLNNISWETTEANYDYTIAGSGISFKLTKLYTAGSSLTSTCTFSPRRNGGDVANCPSVTLTGGGSGTGNDTAHEITYVSGDTWAYQMVLTGTAGVAKQQYSSYAMFAQATAGKGAIGKGGKGGGGVNQFIPSGASSYIIGDPGVEISGGG